MEIGTSSRHLGSVVENVQEVGIISTFWQLTGFIHKMSQMRNKGKRGEGSKEGEKERIMSSLGCA